MWDDWRAIEQAQAKADAGDEDQSSSRIVPFPTRPQPPTTPTAPVEPPQRYQPPEPEPLSEERRYRGLAALRKALIHKFKLEDPK